MWNIDIKNLTVSHLENNACISEHITFDLFFADLPLKTIYYPTERNAKGLGIVLASYTWGGDSTRLLGMPDEEIFEEMMEGLAKVHGRSFK